MAHLRHVIVGPLPISMKAKDEKKNEIVAMIGEDDLNKKQGEERGERGKTWRGLLQTLHQKRTDGGNATGNFFVLFQALS